MTSGRSISHSNFNPLFLFLCGMCMGTADLVPGISGGTIAFIMGFYDPLLESVKTFNWHAVKLFFSGQWRAFFNVVAWKFLLVLLAGVLCAILAFAHLFHQILEHELYRSYLYSTFLGLIIASFFFCLRQVQQWSAIKVAGMILGIVVAYLFTGTSSPFHEKDKYAIQLNVEYPVFISNYDSKHQLLTQLSAKTLGEMVAKGVVDSNSALYNNEGDWLGQISDVIIPYKGYWLDPWIACCGALAICALLLPGVSGSYILTVLGVYPVVIGALAELIAGAQQGLLEMDALYILVSLAIGIVIGFVLFARLVSWLLKAYPDYTIAVLSGCIIGSLRSVWPFWTYTYALSPLKLYKGPQLVLVDPVIPALDTLIPFYALLCFLGGFVLVCAISIRKKTCRIVDLV